MAATMLRAGFKTIAEAVDWAEANADSWAIYYQDDYGFYVLSEPYYGIGYGEPIRWSGEEQTTQEYDIGQAYMDWLYTYLKQMWGMEQQGMAEGSFGDPDENNSAADQIIDQMLARVNAGAFNVTGMAAQLFGIGEFIGTIGDLADTFPGLSEVEETTGFPTGTSEIIPGTLWQSPDGTYYTANGYPIDASYAQQLVDNYYGTGTTGESTALDQANIDLINARIREINNDISMSGQVTPSQQAELDYLYAQLQQQYTLAQQQFGLDYAQYAADLAASPSDWIERWYFEQMMPGAQAPSTIGGWYPTGETEGVTTPMTTGTTSYSGTTTPTPATTGGATWGGETTGWTAPIGTDVNDMIYNQLQNLELAGGTPLLPSDVSDISMIRQKEYSELDPVMRYLIENYGDMTDEEIEWWLRTTENWVGNQPAGVTIPWEELDAKAFELFGDEIGAGDMREYARILRDLHAFEQATSYNDVGIYPGVAPEEYIEYPWRMKLTDIQEQELALSMSPAEWVSTVERLPWETDADVLARYYQVTGLAPPEDMYVGSSLVPHKAIDWLGTPEASLIPSTPESLAAQYPNATWNYPITASPNVSPTSYTSYGGVQSYGGTDWMTDVAMTNATDLNNQYTSGQITLDEYLAGVQGLR